ncbi:hypothetical protein ETB97_005012, partial [Aspergillus alliaceus]
MKDGVRFHDYTISVLELEHHLLNLPYISEAHALPVLDAEAGGLVAALVRFSKQDAVGKEDGNIDLRRIRNDLSVNLVSYKPPALLRVLQNEDQVPWTASGKTLKKDCLRKYFNILGSMPKDYVVGE